MLLIGTIYSWAIFTEPLLVAFQWDLTTTTWAYAIANFSLAAVGVRYDFRRTRRDVCGVSSAWTPLKADTEADFNSVKLTTLYDNN